MKTLWLCPLLLISACQAGELQDRWFFLTRNLSTDDHVAEFEQLATTAAAHGYNGVCWSGLEGVLQFDEMRLRRLAEVRAIAERLGLEIIPLVFTVGYSGPALAYDRNLAVGHRTEGRFRVQGGEAVFLPEEVAVNNPGFEEFTQNRPTGWAWTDKPGEITFADREVFHSGAASLRLDSPGARDLGPHARAMQQFKVVPQRTYRLSVWCKSENLAPGGTFRIQVYGGEKGPALIASQAKTGTEDWHEVVGTFNSGEYDTVRLYAGTWGAQTGSCWIDDMSLTEVGLVNVLHREGCPFELRSADGQTVYVEGQDYAPVVDPQLLNFRTRPSLTIPLVQGSRIQDGQELEAIWYQATQVASSQISVCMSVPKLYEYYDKVAARLAEVLPSRKFLLSMDEIRQGGTDLADQARGMTMGEILGDCITRQQEILRRYHPGATCYIWSDMLDPDHNAHGDYFQVQGDFTGSWEHVPKDLVMACWYGQKAESSLAFFDGLGFRTLGAAYYDTDDLDGSRRWLEALAKTPGSVGIMYTTWRNKYDLLAGFGDLISGERGAN